MKYSVLFLTVLMVIGASLAADDTTTQAPTGSTGSTGSTGTGTTASTASTASTGTTAPSTTSGAALNYYSASLFAVSAMAVLLH